eukprot:8151036-Pyramimonas_sp.AAC.1
MMLGTGPPADGAGDVAPSRWCWRRAPQQSVMGSRRCWGRGPTFGAGDGTPSRSCWGWGPQQSVLGTGSP